MTYKYIVKNCPAYLKDVQLLEFSKGDCNSLQNHKSHCKDCDDCITKQIIDECNKTLDVMKSDSGKNAYAGGRCIQSERIIASFEIQEINE